jgi:hypothetical protein
LVIQGKEGRQKRYWGNENANKTPFLRKNANLCLETQTPDTKKPAIKAGFFFTCIPRQKTT